VRTYSHFLITAAISRVVPSLKDIPKRAIYIGSIAPDIPLLLLTSGSMIYYPYILGWEFREMSNHIFNTLFFTDPFWIISHNFLQAPFILLFAIATLYKIHGKHTVLNNWWFWFFNACLLHATIDMLTHNDDGPLVFFPFAWQVRFSSPVSYWDRDHFGAVFTQFENYLDGVLILYLLIPVTIRRIKRKMSVDREISE